MSPSFLEASSRPPVWVAIAVVADNKDPEGLGRVRILFPWLDTEESFWARVATPMAGEKMGVYFLPDPGDEVLVAFEEGELERPIVIGGLWNGRDLPPEDNADGQNNKRLIRSRGGHEICFEDQDGGGLVLKTSTGQKIVLKGPQGQETITIEDPAGNKVFFDSAKQELRIKSPLKITLEAVEVKIKAQVNLELVSSGTLTIKGTLVQIN